jgi:uncharacterized membrane protein
MLRQRYPLFQGQGHQIILRQRYPLWPLIHLISTALWMVLFIVLVCAFASWLCRKSRHRFHGQGHCRCHGHYCGQAQYSGHSYGCPIPPPSHLDALEILRQRYARGEIDEATFLHMRERLGPSTEPERRSPND